MPRPRLTLMLSLLLLACGLSMHGSHAQQAPTRPVVYLVPIEGVIDLGLAPFVSRVLQEATQAGAAAVVLEIDTFGGRVDAAVQIRDALLESKLRTVAFVDKRAISAGALIALSAQTLAMAPGGTIGAPSEAAALMAERAAEARRDLEAFDRLVIWISTTCSESGINAMASANPKRSMRRLQKEFQCSVLAYT